MLFSTPLFLFVFLPVSLVVYFVTPARLKNTVLLGLSFSFFVWGEPIFTWLVLVSAAADWLLGRKMAYCHDLMVRRCLLAAGVLSNLAILVYYKYTNFLFDNLNVILQAIGMEQVLLTQVMLPIGVSFIVFEKITYLADIYKGLGRTADSIVDYLTYVFLFPKLLAGPIVKYHEIEQQLKGHELSFEERCNGLMRFVVGLAKKVFIADTLAELVDAVFAMQPDELSMGMAWLGGLAFSMQIYFDFSGYSDMAIGMAAMFGFRLRENFNMPYIAINFTDYWRRWHISLSTWIKEYIYIPLGGSRVSTLMIYRNLLIVFILCGLWHGANWTFVVFGLYHGVFMSLDRLFWIEYQKRLPRLFNQLFTFWLIIIGFSIFRSPDISYAVAYLGRLFSFSSEGSGFVYITANVWFFLAVALVMSFLPLLSCFEKLAVRYRSSLLSSWGEPVCLLAMAVLAFAKVSTTTFNPFLYFRF